MSLVSVVIPVFNHAKSLENSLFSLFRQTHRPLEIIVVNDGSTDDFDGAMQRILATEWGKSLNLKILSEENKGAPAARNLGMETATGDYIIFWDADTIGKPKMFETMIKTLENHPEASFAYSQFKFGWKIFYSRAFDFEALKVNNFIDTTSLVRRKDAIKFDEKIKRFQDWDLWLTMSEQKKQGVFIDQVLYQKVIKGRRGISLWLPKIFFRLPFKIKAIKEFEERRRIILEKHQLLREGTPGK